MTSAKRRRSISIDTGYIMELKRLALRDGCKTATNMMTRIVEGTAPATAPAIMPMTPRTQERGEISMPERTWLSIRNRATSRGVTTRHVLECIVVGVQPPLSNEEIDQGMADAKAREARRLAGEPELKLKAISKLKLRPKQRPKKKRARKKVEMKSEEEIVKQMWAEDEEVKRKARLKLKLKPKQRPKPKAKSTMDRLRDKTEQVKEIVRQLDQKPKKKRPRKKVEMKSEEEIVKQMRAEDEEVKRKARAKLSNGDPSTLGKDPKKIDTTAKPGEEYYSGVFSL